MVAAGSRYPMSVLRTKSRAINWSRQASPGPVRCRRTEYDFGRHRLKRPESSLMWVGRRKTLPLNRRWMPRPAGEGTPRGPYPDPHIPADRGCSFCPVCGDWNQFILLGPEPSFFIFGKRSGSGPCRDERFVGFFWRKAVGRRGGLALLLALRRGMWYNSAGNLGEGMMK